MLDLAADAEKSGDDDAVAREINAEYEADGDASDIDAEDSTAVNKALLLRCYEFGDIMHRSRLYQDGDGVVIEQLVKYAGGLLADSTLATTARPTTVLTFLE